MFIALIIYARKKSSWHHEIMFLVVGLTLLTTEKTSKLNRKVRLLYQKLRFPFLDWDTKVWGDLYVRLLLRRSSTSAYGAFMASHVAMHYCIQRQISIIDVSINKVLLVLGRNQFNSQADEQSQKPLCSANMSKSDSESCSPLLQYSITD